MKVFKYENQLLISRSSALSRKMFQVLKDKSFISVNHNYGFTPQLDAVEGRENMTPLFQN